MKFGPVKFPDIDEPTSPLRIKQTIDWSAMDKAPEGAKYTPYAYSKK